MDGANKSKNSGIMLLYSTAFLIGMISAGCGKGVPQSPSGKAAEPTNSPPAAEAVAMPSKEEKACFQCNGTGTIACKASGCRSGKAECPGSCLRLTRGNWIHMEVAGHGPNELWLKIPDQDGHGWHGFSQAHVGEAVVFQNGFAVTTGPCKICGGSTKVNCRSCSGTGKQPCEICKGKKFIPTGWTINDNPWLNSQPDVIRLKQGSPILGKVVASRGDDRTIRTRDNKFIHVNASEIVSPSTGL